MKVFLLDLNKACTSNSHLGACLRDFCRRNRFPLAASYAEADAVIVNGCNVVQSNWELVEAFRRRARSAARPRVIAFGCSPTLRKGAKDPDFHVLPLWQVARDPGLLGRLLGARRPFRLLPMDEALDGTAFESVPGRPDFAGLAYLKVSDGCASACTFCALRQAKGPVRSHPPGQVLRELDAALAKGRRRFFLVSDDATAWGADLGLDLADLIEKIVARAPDCELVSTTFNPSSMIPLMPKLARWLPRFGYLSIPIQSGNDRILRLMKRGYTRAQVDRLLAAVRRANPKLVLNTDAIVGFPTETAKEFADTVQAAKRFDSAFFFTFAPRPFTPAASMKGQVPRDEVRRRIALVRALSRRHRFGDDFRDGRREGGA